MKYQRIADSTHDQCVVRALVQIADGLGMETIAEFVEEERTLSVLQAIGVTYAQGFALGRPAPAQLLAASTESIPKQRGETDGAISAR